MPTDVITFDASSVRRMDTNGNMHVATSPVTRVQVVPYPGREIPGSDRHGFSPERIYQVYRPPEALSDPETIRSCVGIPLQLAHHADYASAPARATRIGSTGDDCRFEDPFLLASLHFQDTHAIELIKTGAMRELSMAYSYVPDFTPGETPDGQPYDVRMTNIRANHIALVEAGRAGPSVMVWDSAEPATDSSQPTETPMETETAAPSREELVAKALAYIGELGLTVADLLPPDVPAKDEDPVPEAAEPAPEAPPAEEPPEPMEEPADEAPEAPAAEPAQDAPDDPEAAEAPEPEAAPEEPAPAADEAAETVAEIEVPQGVDSASFLLGFKAALEAFAAPEDAPAEEPAPDTAAKAEALAQEKLDAADECREELGRVKLAAFDSGAAIYRAALRQMGYTTEISDEAARDVYAALKSSRNYTRPLGSRVSIEPNEISRTLDRVRVFS